MTRRPCVVAITEPTDAHLAFVQEHLDEDLTVVDPLAMQRGDELSYFSTDRTASVIYRDQQLESATGVWYRKPQPIELDSVPVADEFKPYSLSAQQHHFEMLRCALPDALWVSNYLAIERARNKFMQLALARDCGFLVPRTLFTSCKERAKSFIAENGSCIVKPQGTVHPPINKSPTFFFATLIDNLAVLDLDGLHLAPAIFQQAIDTRYDVRVNVVGSKVFSAIIRSEGLPPSSVRDWRIGHSRGILRIDECDLPEDTQHRCLEFNQRSGLMFGAFDLILDTKGNFWFLENNPNGQWAFVEERTGQPIGRSIAALLLRR
jgi:glutathione synthase/RimK-type ligase-like ATP-grasp enzyme